MKTKNEWIQEVYDIYHKIKQHKEAYDIEMNGMPLRIFPNVFSPKYFTDSLYFAQEIAKLSKEKSLLEIGTGTGIIALKAKREGAKNIVAVDINDDALANTTWNAQNLNLDIDVRKSNVFENIKTDETFDIIFWNHPFNRGKNKDESILLRAGFDYEYEATKRYFSEGRKYLTVNGKLLLGTGSFAEIEYLEDVADKLDLRMILIAKKSFPILDGGYFINDFFIYEIKTKTQ